MALTCAIDDLVSEQCGGTLGGIKRVWAAESSDLTALVFTSNEISTITGTAGSFKEIGTVAMDGAAYTEILNDPTANNGAPTWNQSISVIINKLDTATRIALEGIIACCKVVLIVELGDGSRRMVGVDQTAAAPYFAAPVKYMRATVDDTQGGNPGQGQMETLTFTGITSRKSAYLTAACTLP